MEIMSRNDLNFIQMQLKVAIQNHQTLVAKMKTDPQNLVIQKQLHEVQSQIQTLSEKQKSVVQQLRKELVSKQTPAPTVQPVQKPAPTTQLSIIRKPVIQNKPLPQQQQNKQLPQQQQQQNKPLPQQLQQQNKPPVQQTNKPKSVNNNNISKATVNDILNSQSGDQKNNSPLKVPTYQAAHKPTLLQTGHGTRGILKVQQQNNSLPSSPRKKTPTEMCEPYSFAQKCILNKKTGLQADEKEKLEYMASLDLITQDTLKDLQSRRTERKRRSTANPQFSYSSMEPEQKDVHEDFCAICRRSGELLMCDTCSLVYHLNCLDPPLIAVPTGIWSCPKCKGNNVDVDKLSGSMAMVHSQIQARAAKENLKKQLQLKKQALLSDKVVLQDKTKQLSETIKEQIARRSELVNNTHTTQQNVDKLKNVIKVLQS